VALCRKPVSGAASLENVSQLPGWLSTDLAALATGKGFSKRERYFNADECILDVQRPIGINGIGHTARSRRESVRTGVAAALTVRSFNDKGGTTR
jgi:hypothetical protein